MLHATGGQGGDVGRRRRGSARRCTARLLGYRLWWRVEGEEGEEEEEEDEEDGVARDEDATECRCALRARAREREMAGVAGGCGFGASREWRLPAAGSEPPRPR